MTNGPINARPVHPTAKPTPAPAHPKPHAAPAAEAHAGVSAKLAGDHAHVEAEAAHPDAAWKHAAAGVTGEADAWGALAAHQAPAHHDGLLDKVADGLKQVAHHLPGATLAENLFKAKDKMAQGQAMLHEYKAAPTQPAPAAHEQQELHDFANEYMKRWSYDPKHGEAFAPSHALALYKPDAHIEDMAPNLNKLFASGQLEYKYPDTGSYVEPMETLYGTTDRFKLHADPKDLRMTKLGSNPDRFEIMSTFGADMDIKGGHGHASLVGISRLTVERNAHGKLRIVDEVLAPLDVARPGHKAVVPHLH